MRPVPPHCRGGQRGGNVSRLPPNVNRAVYAGARAAARSRHFCSSYARYEVEKSMWANRHLGATSAEYEQAMRAIARACGV